MNINAPDYKINKMSNAAVEKATGRTWPQWCKVLDAEGCKKLNHKEIVAVVSKKFELGPWWQQMVTVGYEQARGLRKEHEGASGFEVSVSRTIAASTDKVFKRWVDPKLRCAWLNGAKFEITTANPNKWVRMKWLADDSRVAVGFYPKGADKVQMAIQHLKLRNAAAVEKMRRYWSARVGELQKCVES